MIVTSSYRFCVRIGAALAVALMLTALNACASGDTTGISGETTPTTEGESLDKVVHELCAEVVRAEENALYGEALDDNLQSVLTAHRDLAAALTGLDPPAGNAAAFDSYVAELGVFVDAMERGYADENDAHTRLSALVENARSAVELKALGDAAGMPDGCPPGEDDVHNTLFVTEANLGCFELGEDVLVGGPVEHPTSAKEIALVVDLGKSVSAGIAGVVRDVSSPYVDERIPVDELIQANQERFLAVEALAESFREGDFNAYERAAKELRRVSRRADRLALSVGLVECAKVFNLLPF